MIYTFAVKEISYGGISVEADSEEEAREKAWDEYHAGNTFWGDADVDLDLEEIKE